MTKRKFYRTVVEIEILSEEPIAFESLGEINHAITEGDCSGSWNPLSSNEVVDGKTIVKLLKKQGSDPGFFRLDERGNDLEDDEWQS